MDRICFVGSGKSFINQDIDMLESLGYDIDQHSFKGNLLPFFLSYRREIKRAVQDADIVFGWFASWETLPAIYYAQLYSVPSIIVIGGYDAAHCPEIGYGAWVNAKERQAARYVAHNASLLLPVSRLTLRDLLQRVSPSGDVRLLYNGIDIKRFKPAGKKRDIAICVGAVKQNNIVRKGLEFFVRTAALLPDVDFVVVGKKMDNSIDYLERIATRNVKFTGYISDEKLLELYQQASVVCQLSYYEAFGMAPLEGMACCCTPVVTGNKTGMPEFVCNAGFYTHFGDIGNAAHKIRSALEDDGTAARRQAEIFSVKYRRDGLSEILQGLVQ